MMVKLYVIDIFKMEIPYVLGNLKISFIMPWYGAFPAVIVMKNQFITRNLRKERGEFYTVKFA